MSTIFDKFKGDVDLSIFKKSNTDPKTPLRRHYLSLVGLLEYVDIINEDLTGRSLPEGITEDVVKGMIVHGIGDIDTVKVMSDGGGSKPTGPKYLTFTAGKGGASVGFHRHVKKTEPTQSAPVFEYSIDGGETWLPYVLGDGTSAVDAKSTIVSLNEGDSVMFRGTNEIISESGDVYIKCNIDGSVAASGDVTSLLNSVGGDVAVPQNCYRNMFGGCTGLTQAPALPATTLAPSCYSDMFNGCSSLTQAPALPATTLADYCYNNMFNNCTSLTQAPALPAATLADHCYQSMFGSCTSLTTAPSLPATTLADYCYNNMFGGCTSLTTAPSLPATTLAYYCYYQMFFGCKAIISHDVATLNNSSSYVFATNTSCVSLTIHDDTPPTIAADTITGLKADCIIYVPAGSVDAYKKAQYWSARASYIQAIP